MMALMIANELQNEESYLSSMGEDNIEGPDMNYVAPMTVSGSQNDEAHQLCKGNDDKEDTDIDLTAPTSNEVSNSDVQQNRVLDTFVLPLDFEVNTLPKEGNNLEIMITDMIIFC